MSQWRTRRPVFQLFGDSITQHAMNVEGGAWGARLAHAYSRKADVIVRGYSGYNSRLALALQTRKREEGVWGAPDLVTVWFGANDAASNAQHVPLEEYRANVAAMARAAAAVPGAALGRAPRVFVLTPPPCDGGRWAAGRAEDPPSRSLEASARYAEAARLAARDAGALVADVHADMAAYRGEGGWRALLSDGLHLSAEGGRQAFLSLARAIARDAPDLRPAAMAADWPMWGEVDPAAVEASFVRQRQ